MKQITACLLHDAGILFSRCKQYAEMGQPPSSNVSDVLVSALDTAESGNTNTPDSKVPNDLKAGAYVVYQSSIKKLNRSVSC